MNDDEALSRWLEGDLPPLEAQRLEARLQAEPALAARLALLRQVVADLEAIPEVTPPAALDARVLGDRSPIRHFTGWAGRAAVAAAVVFALGLALRPEPRSHVALGLGTELVAGAADVAVGDLTVVVDGVARITVEPAGRVARGGGSTGASAGTEASMHPALTHAATASAAALGGAAITVAVLQGTARIALPGQDPISLAADQVWTGQHPGAPLRMASAVPPAPVPPGETPDQAIARLVADNANLRAQLSELGVQAAFTRGQLAQTMGEPLAFPADLPDALKPDQFQADVRARVAEIPGAQVTEFDCSEYPCLAVITAPLGPDGRPPASLLELGQSLSDSAWKGLDLGVSLSATMAQEDEGGGVATVVLGAARDDDDADTRTRYRSDALIAH